MPRKHPTYKTIAPCIVEIDGGRCYRVQVQANNKKTYVHFFASNFDSQQECIDAALKRRDDLKSGLIESIEWVTESGVIPEGKRYKPAITSQFQLWHKRTGETL